MIDSVNANDPLVGQDAAVNYVSCRIDELQVNSIVLASLGFIIVVDFKVDSCPHLLDTDWLRLVDH